jgi:TonB-dependent receptor-like protein/carboxypeptidase family protein
MPYAARAGWLVLLLGALGVPVRAQSDSPLPSVRVGVTDAQQLPIPGATCTLIPAGAPSGDALVADQSGVCVFTKVQPGIYVVRVELEGFDPFTRERLVISPDAPAEVTAVLTVAKLAQNVTVTAAPEDTTIAAGSTPPAGNLEHNVLRKLPLPGAALDAALPLVPGVLRSSTGELSFNGATERQSALLVNGMNAADPATGNFRLSLPIDSVEAVQVFLHPYTAEYGQFTGGITRVYTREGGEKWHFELNDFLPDLRFVNGKVHGVAEDSPHLNLGGPMMGGKLRLSESIAYTIAKTPVRGLDFPDNETRSESFSTFTQLDFSAWQGHAQRATFGYAPARDDYVGLDVFSPKPVTPSRTQADVWGTLRDNSQIFGGLLTSAVSYRSFDVDVFGQGSADMTLTPTVETGNYFATQNRQSSRLEIFESFSFPTWHFVGTHDFKVGADVNYSTSELLFQANPVNVIRADGTLARRIVFEDAAPIDARNREATAFVQDRWTIGPRLSVDFGLRFENQDIADPHLVVPRAGLAWSPRANGRTVIRGGIGLFYDKVPLNIRSFAEYPARTITRYAADGVTVTDLRLYQNMLADAETPRRVNNKPVEDERAFVPENLTWNVQVDHTFSPILTLRANVTSSQTDNIYIVQPRAYLSGAGAILLSSTGESRYRALELTGRLGRADRSLNVSYTRSRARGDLNDFNAAFGDFAYPIIRSNQYSNLPQDTPNRFLAWGSFELPHRFNVAPVFEARTGFPYSVRDEEQNFVGIRNSDSTRFPWFIAIDTEVSKELRVSRNYAIKLSVRGFNLTNHFNPRDVRSNLGDPQFGQFLASYRRYFAAGFDIVF